MKYCANLSALLTDLPFLERFGAARSAGFDGVEVPFPYDAAVPDMLDMLARNALDLVMIACPPPNYTGAARGFAAVPGQQERFQRDFKRTHRYAKALGVTHIHVMAGVAEGDEARAVFVENLRWAAKEAPQQSLTIEAMAAADVPGYFLNDVLQAADIAREVGGNLGVQFDVAHAQQIHGDIAALWPQVADVVRHIQVAQTPARGHPSSAGEIDVKAFLKVVKASPYKGWIAGEYAQEGPLDWAL